jgi:hypothetical protein
MMVLVAVVTTQKPAESYKLPLCRDLIVSQMS